MIRFGFLVMLLCTTAIALATPPDYASFHRDQKVDHTPDGDKVMRIWVPFVGQGDAILIQFPRKYAYELEVDYVDEPRLEFVDFAIDAGSFRSSERTLFRDFLADLYPEGAVIEYALISHHDSDHVSGFTPLLADPNFGVETFYHNGLASYRSGHRDFPAQADPPSDAVLSTNKNGGVSRWMARVDASGALNETDLVEDLNTLTERYEAGDFHNIYERLARAIVEKEYPFRVEAFDRVSDGEPMALGAGSSDEVIVADSDLSLEVIWPRASLSPYGSGRERWGKTINGNSVTFQLEYDQFQMLFTGDHNAKSEPSLLTHLDSTDIMETDVMKVPHHGSDKGQEAFFRDARVSPVVAVASMGSTGFKSKMLNNNRGNWQHPSTNVIRWLGGSHRVYHTYIHEKRFDWDDLVTPSDHAAMVEKKHILIETDGEWFRIVETAHPFQVPSVTDTRRGNGTRWIRARREQ